MPATSPIPPMHHMQPSWILSAAQAEEDRADDTVIAPWRPLQRLLEAMSDIFSVEIVVINKKRICVSGTGPYSRGIGLTAPADTALAHSLTSQGCVLVHNPREHAVCLDCSLRDDCRDQANYSGPVTVAGQLVAAVQIVAFDTLQRSVLLEKAEAAFSIVRQMVGLLFQERAIACEGSPQDARHPIFYGLIGNSPAMMQLRHRIQRAAASDGTVLITGETGTGKELIARAIHEESGRSGPFIPVNCGALPEQLVESELFGYARGAFSGAAPGGHPGLWESAHGGTLFLDEVGELPPSLQVKLLRALQDGGIRRVGDSTVRSFDTRIIAATNLSLADKVQRGLMRQDLYYRLKVIPIRVPALRERPEDISLLANYFLKQCCTRNEGRIIVIDAELMQHFLSYAWPGNVRELQNCIEYGVNTCEGTAITWESLFDYFDQHDGLSLPSAHPEELTFRHKSGKKARPPRTSAEEIERVLAQCGEEYPRESSGWVKREAARRLGISLATLYRLLKQEETPRQPDERQGRGF